MTRLKTFRLGITLAVFVLGGCAHVAPPEPVVRTVEIRVPVPTPCPILQRLGPAPSYPDSDAALRSAPDIGSRVGLLLAGRVLRIARLSATEAAMRACEGAP